MTKETVDEHLLFAAFRAALFGANQYLKANNLKASDEALQACTVSWVRIKLPEALRDAKEALACHMDKVAETTFAASMVQAGIEAAKECGMPIAAVSENLNQSLI